MRRQQGALLALVSDERDDNLPLDDTLARITKVAGTTLDVERTSVWLFTEDRSKLVCRSPVSKKPRASDGLALIST
jgi:hypothetical protein